MDRNIENLGRVEKKEINVHWIRPNLENEKGEIQRVLEEFLTKEVNQENIKVIIDILDNAPIIELSDESWESLQNTDSFHIRPGHLEDAEAKVEEYNQGLAPEYRRDFKKLLDAYTNEFSIESPIIIKNKDGVLHLLSGNTRLMIAKALGIRPKVIIGEWNTD